VNIAVYFRQEATWYWGWWYWGWWYWEW